MSRSLLTAAVAVALLLLPHGVESAIGAEYRELDVIAPEAIKPHIFYFLVDDFGWANAGWHSPNNGEVRTPNLVALVKEGVEIDRLYAHKFCGPSRAALQTGRAPIHVTVLDDPISDVNLKDPVGGFQGIPRNMTAIAQKLHNGGYATHMVGKWHCGLATPDHTPYGRGYDTSLNYFDAANDYWNSTYLHPCQGSTGNPVEVFDFWNTTGPAKDQRNKDPSCSQASQGPNCIYEDDILMRSALQTIAAHDPSTPLFFLFSAHNIHEPYQVPNAYLAQFPGVEIEVRQYYDAMVKHIDDVVGNVTAALKAKGMWDNLLFITTSDNGGPLADGVIDGLDGTSGANNYPLRGGKIGVMEGGVRVNAFVSGGFVPSAVRGTKVSGLMELADFYVTFCGLAGVDPTDHAAKLAGLPPVEGMDMWPMLSGANLTSPRTEIAIGSSDDSDHQGNTIVQALIMDDGDGKIHKLIIGDVKPAFFQGPVYPNASSTVASKRLACGDPDGTGVSKGPGCLFEIGGDPSETMDLAATNPGKVDGMRKRMTEIQKTVYNPERKNAASTGRQDMCDQAKKNGMYLGPWLP